MTRSDTNGRALVLGGGGVTGIAWELGILKGLADAGVDLTTADLVIGTSAGSVVGAQITTGATIDELYDTQLEPADKEIGAKLSRLT
jgi:NTE family protein